jgi:hypothetical protein
MGQPQPKPRKPNKADELDAEIKRLASMAKLDGWNAFVEELKLPQDVYPALISNRPELLRLIQPRAMNEQEAGAILKVLAGVIETNIALRQHAEQLAQFTSRWTDAFKHLRSLGERIENFANFKHRSAAEGGEDEED